MIFYINESKLNYEIGNIFRIFFPYDEFKIINELTQTPDLSILLNEKILEFKGELYKNAVEKSFDCSVESDKEFFVCKCLYNIFVKIKGYKPKWGMLTGIHPVKLYTSFETSEEKQKFQENYMVSDEKIEMCSLISKIQKPYIGSLEENDFSLYISIPFCPSRCNYCSFVSQSVERTEKLIPPYVDLLVKEIEYTAEIVRKNRLILKSVYFGGGTPTTLNCEQLEKVITTVQNNFNMNFCTEFTVEAGRADTITKEKLLTLKALGVQRISINPQTLNDDVLKIIGRKHSAKDVLDKFEMANEIGFNSINMDLIAGLQGDNFESFKQTLNKVISLAPSNITVHSLALKRSAEIFRKEETVDYHSDISTAEKMIEYSNKRLFEEGYIPYYLYRQSRMAGNAENTGWSKPNFECAYNIYTMDECQTVIACGAGGVTKLKDPYSKRLERVFNFKYSHEYINRFDEILTRKDEVTNLYEQFRKRIY